MAQEMGEGVGGRQILFQTMPRDQEEHYLVMQDPNVYARFGSAVSCKKPSISISEMGAEKK